MEWLGSNITTLVAIAALLLTAWQIRLSTDAQRASIISDVTARTAELQWRSVTDTDLLEPDKAGASAARTKKQKVATGIVINHFATMYDLHKLCEFPPDLWVAIKLDMQETMKTPQFQAQWQSVRGLHRRGFARFVDDELGIAKKPETSEGEKQ